MISESEGLLLWVDHHNSTEIRQSIRIIKEKGIQVERFKSSTEIIKYLQSIPSLKRKNNLRIITNRIRPNGESAESFISWLRKNDWNCPVLVYCGKPNLCSNLESKYTNVQVSKSKSKSRSFGSMESSLTFKNPDSNALSSSKSKSTSSKSSKLSSPPKPTSSPSLLSPNNNKQSRRKISEDESPGNSMSSTTSSVHSNSESISRDHPSSSSLSNGENSDDENDVVDEEDDVSNAMGISENDINQIINEFDGGLHFDDDSLDLSDED